MTKHAISLTLVLALAGCGGGPMFGSGGGGGLFGGDGLFGRDRAQPSAAMAPGVDTPRPEARPGAGGTAAAEAPAAGEGGLLGTTVASLGDASVPGFWIETPLVSREGPGRVVGPDGTTISVTLRPSGGSAGSGSRLSLQAMQALGIALTSLPTVTVISDA
jgi:hypothetical protein